MRLLVYIWILLFVSVRLTGQNSPVFRHFSTEDGLPGSQVYQVVSDHEGVLWFATDHGLVSYNGYEFKTWSQAEGLTDNTVFKLFLDKRRCALWMQTYSGGLFFLKDKKIYPYRYNAVVKQQILEKIPLGMYVTDKEDVVFTSTTQLEVKIDTAGSHERLMRFGNVGDDAFVYLHECEPGRFVSSSSNVLANYKRLRFIYRDVAGQVDTMDVPHQEIGHVTARRLRDGRLMVIIGYYIYTLKQHQLVEFGRLPFLANNLFEDKSGDIWVSSYNGVLQLDLTDEKCKYQTFLEGSFVSCIAEDIEGTIWITTVNRGIFSLSDRRIKMYSFENRPQQEPLALAANREEVFVSFWNGYILKMNSAFFGLLFVSGRSVYQ